MLFPNVFHKCNDDIGYFRAFSINVMMTLVLFKKLQKKLLLKILEVVS